MRMSYLVFFGALLLLAFCPSAGLAQGPGGGRGGGRGGRGGGAPDPNQIWNFIAKGKDVIVRSEMDPRGQGMFDRWAKDAGVTDGQITKQQFLEAMAKQMGGRIPGGGPGGPPSPGGPPADPDAAATAAFRQLDKNGDGFLNSDEMPPELKADLAKWDANKDGMIDLNEYKAFVKGTAQPSGFDPAGGWIQEQPAEEEVKRKPVMYRAGKLPKGLPAWFEQLDTDKDGQIGLYEWKASGKPFDEFVRMDRNGDGFLTIEEVLFFEARNKKPGDKSVASASSPGQTPATGPGPAWQPGGPGPGAQPGGAPAGRQRGGPGGRQKGDKGGRQSGGSGQ